MHITIEPSKSGKTFGVGFCKEAGQEPFFVMKGCRLANGANGPFVSGPSTKMDDGKWFNYSYFDKKFSEYVTGLAQKAVEAAPAAPKAQAAASDDIPF